MATILDFYEYAKLTMAAYVDMDDIVNFSASDFAAQANVQRRLPTALANQTFDGDSNEGQDREIWIIPAGGYLGNDGTGYAATLFKRDGEIVLAIRGTELEDNLLADLLRADLAEIGFVGLAISQAVSMVNHILRLTAPVPLKPNENNVVQLDVNLSLSEPSEGTFVAIDGGRAYLSVTASFSAQGLGLVNESESITVTGHSLGGHLAVLAARLFPQLVTEAFVYNAPGFDPTYSNDILGAIVAILTLNPTLGGLATLTTDELQATDEFVQLITPFLSAPPASGFSELTIHNLESEDLAPGDDTSLIPSVITSAQGLGEEISITTESNSHLIEPLMDSLALHALLARLDSNVTLESVTSLYLASSDKISTSQEKLAEALHKLFLGSPVKLEEVNVEEGFFGQLGIGVGDIDGRRDFYEKLINIEDSALYKQAVGQVQVLPLVTLDANGEAQPISVSELENQARNFKAYRYALRELNPFVITGDDAIYDQHNDNNELELENFSDNYLKDRAEFLVLKIGLFKADKLVADDELSTKLGLGTLGNDRRYNDIGARLVLSRDAQFAGMEQQYVFGTDFSDGEINGGEFDDHLYGGGGLEALNGFGGDDYLEGGLGTDQLAGGAGADTLVGGKGNDFLYGADVGGADDGAVDILEGGEGEDSYFAGNGDIVNDSDRTVRIIELNGQRVNGDYFKSADNVYKSDATGLTITVSGTQALVEKKSGDDVLQSFTIKNFKDAAGTFSNGDYGIRLLDEPGGTFIEASKERDRLELHDGATRLEILEGEVPGTTGTTVTFALPALGILGNGGDDDLFIVDGAGGLFISGDGFEEAAGDGDDFISATDLEALAVGDIPEDGAFGVTILGQGGDDILEGSLRADTVRGGSGHDLITGVHGADRLEGGTGNDLIEGNEDNDHLQGGVGNDRLLGGAGFDVVFGGGGDDQIYGDADFGTFGWDGANENILVPDIFWFDPVQEGQPVHTFSIFQEVDPADADSDFLYGGSGEDRLFGGAGDDFLYGEANDDVLQGEAGDDRLFGGAGEDTLWGDKDPASFDKDVEVLEDQTRVFPSHSAEFILRGHKDGKDVAGDDLLDGGAGNDRLHGGADNDTYVFGFGDGSDVVFDQSGNADRVQLDFTVTPENVNLEAFGSDVVLSLVDSGGIPSDRLTLSNWNGSGKIESIEFANGTVWDTSTIAAIVGPFDDDGLGESISAFFAGGPGNDLVQGLDANEAIYGNQGNDQIQAGGGNDRIFGGTGNDVLFGESGGDVLFGQAGDDQLLGGDGADRLRGNEGNDQLFGQAGNDLLAGGTGNDQLLGGEDDDVYAFNHGDSADVIFESGDTQNDILRFGEGIGPGDIAPAMSGADLLISHVNGTDSVTVDGWFSDPALKLGAVEFADGTIWDVPTIESLLPDGFLLRDGDVANGNQGPSTYFLDVTAADGFDITIHDAGGDDRLILDRVLYNTSPFFLFRTPVLDDITRSGNALVLGLTIDDDNAIVTDARGTITIQNYYTDSGFIESIEFANGTVLNSPNTAPVLANRVADQIIALDTAYSFSLPENQFTDDVLDLLSISATLADGSALPAWLDFNPATSTFSGTPAAADRALLDIEVKATDRAGASASDRFLLNVGSVNQNPQSAPDSATTPEDTTLTIAAADLLANDSDPNGDILTLTAAGIPQNGTVTLDINGNVEFTPARDFNGTASFAYLAEDDNGGFAVGTVTVEVTPVNDPPTANPDAGIVSSRGLIVIDVLANDSDVDTGDDASSFTLDSVTVQGALGAAGIAGNRLQFDTGTDFDFLGPADSATVLVDYTMSDGSGAVSSSTATVTVVKNQDPVANPDSAELLLEADPSQSPTGNRLTIDVLANDTDPDPNEDLAAFTLSSVSVRGDKGTAAISDNKLVFDPGTDFDGLGVGASEDIVVDYTVTDDGGASASSTATVTVRANRAPIAVADEVGLAVAGTPGEFLVSEENARIGVWSAVAAQPDGSFLAVWEDFEDFGMKGQLFDASAQKVGSPITLSSGGLVPDVAALSDRRYAVTWGSRKVDIQIIDGQGNKVGGLIQALPEERFSFREKPKIAGLPDGGFVVVWQDGSGRRFDAAGNPVDTSPITTMWEPNVAATSDGGFYIVSWDVRNSQDVFGQKFDANGIAGPLTKISNEINESSTANPQVATLANGNIVVTWTESDAGALGPAFEGNDILGQILSPAGVKLGGNFLINANTFGDQEFSGIAALPDGGFVVVWHSDGDAEEGFSREIIGQRFDGEGQFVGQPFMVNSFTDDDQLVPDISSFQDGRAIVTWFTEDPAIRGISGRLLDFDASQNAGASVSIDVLANDSGEDPSDGPGTLTLESVSLRGDRGQVSIIDNKLEFSTGTDFGDLAPGVVESVIVDYVVADDAGATSASTATIHLHDELTIVGTSGDDSVELTDQQTAVTTFEGNDTINVVATTNGVTVNAGPGNDHITLNGRTNAGISTGPGNNRVNVTLSSPRSTNITTGSGSNLLFFAFPTFGDPLLGLANATVGGGSGPNSYVLNDYLGTNTNARISIDDRSGGGSAGAGFGRNTLTFGNSVSGNVTLSLGSLQINIEGSDLKIDLENLDPDDVVSGPRDIDFFEFSDGVVLTYEQFVQRGFDIDGTNLGDNLSGTDITDRLNGLAGNDVILAGSGNDILTGGPGDDVLDGGPGDDVYVFGPGDGKDTVRDGGGIDRFVFTEGVTLNGVDIIASGDDLVLLLSPDDQITIENWFAGVEHQIERFLFNDDPLILLNGPEMEARINQAPVVAAGIDDQSIDEDVLFRFPVPDDAFIDPDVDDALTFSAAAAGGASLPSWLSFDPGSAVFSGTPANDDVGSTVIEVTAADPQGKIATDAFTLTVINVNDPPVAADDVAATNEDNAVVITNLLANDIDIDVGDVIFISEVDPASAAGAAVALAADGTVTYDPLDSFQFLSAGEQAIDAFVYVVGDGNGGFSDANVSVVIDGVNDAPFVSVPVSDQVTQEGADFHLDLPTDTFEDADASDVLSFQAFLDSGEDLPAWLSFDPITLSFTGTPPFDAAGEYGITVSATDLSGASAGDSFTLKVINVINGSGKSDKLFGTPDEDIINGLDKNDMLFGEQGDDQVNGGPGNDHLFGEEGDDLLAGGDGNDRILGGSGNDLLSGGPGNDHLIGGTGNDVLDGGAGNDVLEGGEGNDVYLFSSGWGADSIVENDLTPGNTDTLAFENGIAPLDLVFQRTGNDLLLWQAGTSNSIAVQNWYVDPVYQVERVQSSDGGVLPGNQVDQLIQAMAAFSADTGVSWEQALVQRPDDVEAVLAVHWQPGP